MRIQTRLIARRVTIVLILGVLLAAVFLLKLLVYADSMRQRLATVLDSLAETRKAFEPIRAVGPKQKAVAARESP